MTKNIIITGGAGLIGLHLTKSLLKKGYKLFVIDNLSRGKFDNEFKEIIKNKKVNFLKINLGKKIPINFKNIDLIFHLAGSVGVKNITDKPYNSFLNNVSSLKNIISLNKKLKKEAKIILFSTSEVYSPLIASGKVKYPIKESSEIFLNSETSKRDAYYLSKIFNEKLVELSCKNYLILRPHNIYGPRMGYSHVIPELIKKMYYEKINRTKSTIVYSPTHKRAFCYIDDAVSQIIKLSLNRNIKNEVFNIGNMDEEIKIIELAKIIKKLYFKKSKINLGPITQGSPARRVPNMKKTKSKTKIFTNTNLKEGVKKTLNWYISDLKKRK